MKNIMLLTMVIAFFAACNPTKDTVEMTVASEKRMAMGAFPMEVLLVKEGNATEWSYFYSDIEGFNHETGYEYVLKVRKESLQEPIPQDISSFRYILVKEISKTKKDSENMPEGIPSPELELPEQ